MSKWCRLASYLAQFQLMINIYQEISHGINQICSGHNCLVIPVSPQFPDDTHSSQSPALMVLLWNRSMDWLGIRGGLCVNCIVHFQAIIKVHTIILLASNCSIVSTAFSLTRIHQIMWVRLLRIMNKAEVHDQIKDQRPVQSLVLGNWNSETRYIPGP